MLLPKIHFETYRSMATLLILVSACLMTITAELCVEDICEYHFEIRRWRSMTYYTPKGSYNVELNGTRLQITENSFRKEEKAPLAGSFVNSDDVITADGFRRELITINDQFPGPTIEVMKGAEVCESLL